MKTFSKFIFEEKEQTKVLDPELQNLWYNLWDSIFELSNEYARELYHRFNLTKELLLDYSLVDNERRIEIINLIQNHLTQRFPDMDFGLTK